SHGQTNGVRTGAGPAAEVAVTHVHVAEEVAAGRGVVPYLLLVGEAGGPGGDQRWCHPPCLVPQLCRLRRGDLRGDVDPGDAEGLDALARSLRVLGGEVRGQVREVQTGAVRPVEAVRAW